MSAALVSQTNQRYMFEDKDKMYFNVRVEKKPSAPEDDTAGPSEHKPLVRIRDNLHRPTAILQRILEGRNIEQLEKQQQEREELEFAFQAEERVMKQAQMQQTEKDPKELESAYQAKLEEEQLAKLAQMQQTEKDRKEWESAYQAKLEEEQLAKLAQMQQTEKDHKELESAYQVSSDSGRGASGIETPTATSQNEPNEYTVYEFDFPTDECGRLIGRSWKNINSLKAQTGTEIILRRLPGIMNYHTCSIEGKQSQVRAALELIKSKFPTEKYMDISYRQTNCLDKPQVMQLNLPQGVSLNVIVSSVVDANHVFIQQVAHPTFPSLEKLGQFMVMCYDGQGGVPQLPRPIETGMICAVPMFIGWYRAMVTATYPDTDEVEVKLLDYGGYMQVNALQLRPLRTDFMGLPFQATECFLANVVPLSDQKGFGVGASALLESLVQGNLLQAQIVGRAEDGSPYIELYSTSGAQPVFVNRELVNMGVAWWYEMPV